VTIAELLREPTVRLTIPAGGTIVVTAKDAGGAPYDQEIRVEDEEHRVFEMEPERRAGQYTFRHIPCGRRWHVVVNDGGMLRGLIDPFSVPVAGPRTNDEVVAVAVDVPVRTWLLRCRLARTDGAPVTDAKIIADIAGVENESWSHMDESGLIERWIRTTGPVRDLSPLQLRVTSPLCQTRTIVVDRPLPPGTHELGEIAVDPPTGEVLLARVELRAANGLVPDDVVVELRAADGERRDPVPVLRREVGGFIELRGVPLREPMLLHCWHPQFAPVPPQPVRIGEHYLVELQPLASLQVAVSVDDLPLASVQGYLTRHGLDRSDDEDVNDQLHALIWPHLLPGRYSLRLMLGEHLLHEVADLELQPHANRWPADGTRIDLHGKLKVILMATHPAVDSPSARFRSQFLMVDSTATSLPANWEDQVEEAGWLIQPPTPHDVLVRAQGHVPVRLRRPTSDLSIRMQPCTQIAVQGGADRVCVRILTDAVADPLLRDFDLHAHAAEFETGNERELLFAPGTVIELTPMRGGKRGSPQRVVVGTESPQIVRLP
jgi:hypothetical protein